MFRNLSFILRRFSRQKLNTTLHIVGLTLGITVCLLIALFIRHEASFDTYHDNYERIYRITTLWQDGEMKNYTFSTPMPMADALRANTAVEKVVLAHPQSDIVVDINGSRKFLQEKILIVSPEFLDVFKIVAISGDARQAIRKPYHAVLTRATAKKYFGDENPVGKT